MNRPIKNGQIATDLDVIVFEGRVLYLFECKHSLPPTGPHEMRDIWEDIEKGFQQLETATRILSDPARCHSYLAGWFPGTRSQDLVGLKIVPCVLSSHRIFAGLHCNGIPVRDFSSLSRLCDVGVIGMGRGGGDEVILRQYRIIRGKKFSASDLEDYCSPDSIFFKTFKPFMHAVTRFDRLGDLTIARETFVYEVELDDWARHMEALGCVREPDWRQSLKQTPATFKTPEREES